MTRPTGFYVLGQPFTLTFLAVDDSFGVDGMGVTDGMRQTTKVVEGLSPHQERDTVLHEVIHACLLVLGKGKNEELVGVLTPALLDALRSNKPLAAYLLEDV